MLSLSCSFMKLSNAFVYPDPESSINNILCRWSKILCHFLLWSLLLSFVTSSKLNDVVCYKRDV